jgi:hypothetical protein
MRADEFHSLVGPGLSTVPTHWTAFLKKNLLGSPETKTALHDFLSFRKAAHSRKPDESRIEFIFQAHHQTEAIFSSGLPDLNFLQVAFRVPPAKTSSLSITIA